MTKKIRILALALSALMMLSACGGGGSSTPAPSAPADGGVSTPPPAESNNATVEVKAPADKDELVVVVATEPSGLDPHNLNMVTGFMINKHIFDRLFVTDSEYNITPSLAESYEWVDDTTLRVKIREGVKFTDGDPLTAEDVVYTIKRACEKPQSATAFGPFDAENTVAVDEYTVDIKTKYAYPNAVTVLASGRAGIVSQKSIEEMGDDAYGRAPVGSGKFKVVNWAAGDRIELTRNDDYWGEKPAYKDLTFRIITENASRAIEVETGGADIVFNVSSEDLTRLKENPEINVVQGGSATMNHIVINSVNFDTLKDVRVRKAMHMALDMNAIVQVAYKGNAQVASSLVPAVTTNYAQVGPETYDPEGAKALLAESGFDTSTEIKLNIYKNAQIEAVAEMLCNMWNAIGLNVQIEMMDRATMVTNNGQGKTPFYISSVTASDGNIESVFRMWETPSYGFTDDEDLRARITAAKGIMDDAEREKAYAELQQECWDLHTVIPICTADNIFATAGYVQGFEFQPDNSPDLSVITFNK